MTRDDLVKTAYSGDCLLVHGNSLVQEGIERATCSPFCHVAMLAVVGPGQLAVCEMVEGVGYQSMLLNDWLADRNGQQIFFGKAPDVVHANADRVIASLQEYQNKEKREYGYGELFTVWLSQFTGKDYETKHEVCSLFVQHRWEIAGYATPGCAAPGDFLFFCDSVSLIK